MKRIYIITLSLIISLLSAVAQDNKLPELNKKIIKYVKSVIGTQVDRGECWDLANQALTRNHAKWDGEYQYGKPIDPKKDDVLPGDLIQFKNVKVTYKVGNTIYKEIMAHHTAIVYKVLGPGKFEIAHQNNGFSGRKVGISSLDISTVTKGKMYFYRPELME
jgi:hypothetical protein